MRIIITGAIAAAIALGGGALAQDAPRTDKGKLSLFEGNDFDRDWYEVKGARPSITLDFPVNSIAVYPGEKWEICEGKRYKEPCMTIDSNQQNLDRIVIGSARPVKD